MRRLADSAVRLVDARFLIELHKRGGRLPRRQLLPDGAFLTLDELKRLPKGGFGEGCLRIAATSHAWQQPDTPDPKGLSLKLLAEFLAVLLSKGNATYAIFLDFNSLHQKSASGERNAAEAELFGRALSNMMIWYSHYKLLTLKLTQLPPGYPQGFDFPPGMTPNVADYFDRGWCFCESSVSGMAKNFDYVLDLAKFSGTKDQLSDVLKECAANRPAPLTPDDFALALSSKSFTSKKADEKMVADLYAATFREQMGAVTKLVYPNLQWGDAQVAQLCKVIASGALASLKELILAKNSIGDVGMQALAGAVSSGALASLECLRLQDNTIGDAGLSALAEAMGRGGLDHLTVCWCPTALSPCLETWHTHPSD
jgi:hypothetical protein